MNPESSKEIQASYTIELPILISMIFCITLNIQCTAIQLKLHLGSEGMLNYGRQVSPASFLSSVFLTWTFFDFLFLETSFLLLTFMIAQGHRDYPNATHFRQGQVASIYHFYFRNVVLFLFLCQEKANMEML